MRQELLSRALTIADTRAAAALVDPASRAMVLAFAGQPRPMAEVARDHDFDLKRLHHHVLRFCRLGLLEVAETRARAGRPIRLYRTTAEAFFVPHAAAPELFTESLSRDLRAGLRLAATRPGKGMVVYADAHGIPRAEAAGGDTGPEAVEVWRIVRLTPRERADFAAEMGALIERYARQGGRGAAVLVHAAIAPYVGAETPPETAPAPAEAAARLLDASTWSAKARIRIV